MIPQKPKVLVTEHSIQPIITTSQNLPQAMTKVISNNIYLSISRYTDSLMIIINQTGTMGSIYSGRYAGQCLPQLQQQQDEQFYQHPQQRIMSQDHSSSYKQLVTQKLYDIKCLFGSTEIEFYQLLMRKILGVIFQQNKFNQSIKVILNVSLPVKCKLWDDYQHRYYQQIIEKLQVAVKEIN